jgi:multiple antibiotic resistance protein
MTTEFLLHALSTLFVTVDPVALAPIFIALTAGMSPSERREVALRAVIIAFFVLTGFALAGQRLLALIGVSLAAFRIAGGLLLFWTAFEMVFGNRQERKAETAQAAIMRDRIRNVAAFPLAVPLIAGPGAITASMLLASRAGDDLLALAGLIGAITVVLASCFLVGLLAVPIDRLLGETGRVVLSRILGLILGALAVQFVADGALQFVRGGT